jgi:hypothetical protein
LPERYSPSDTLTRTTLTGTGTLPRFEESSSQELANLLATINSKVLLPRHLTRDQQKLVYKQENRTRLEAEPIEITLGDVTLPLEHIDRNKDQPGMLRSLMEAIEQSKTPQDWENVLRLLEGYYDANCKIHPKKDAKIIALMCEADMHHLVLKALWRAEKTGLRLRHTTVIKEVFSQLHAKAARSEFAEQETEKMLRFSEQCVELMEDPAHLGKKDACPGDPRGSVYVISVPAALAAARAKKHLGGVDTDGKVRRYASRLMAALQDQTNAVSGPILDPQEDRSSDAAQEWLSKQMDAASAKLKPHELRAILRDLIIISQAIKTCREVLGSAMPASEEAARIQKAVQGAVKNSSASVARTYSELSLPRPPVLEVVEQCAKL